MKTIYGLTNAPGNFWMDLKERLREIGGISIIRELER